MIEEVLVALGAPVLVALVQLSISTVLTAVIICWKILANDMFFGGLMDLSIFLLRGVKLS